MILVSWASLTLTALGLVRAVLAVHLVVTLRVLLAHTLTVGTGEGVPRAPTWDRGPSLTEALSLSLLRRRPAGLHLKPPQREKPS